MCKRVWFDMKRILWIEDDGYLLQSMINPLEESGYIVHSAEDATDALDVLDKFGIDLIILDMLLPCGEKVNAPENEEYVGLYLLKVLRQNGINLPVIVFSVAYSEMLKKEMEILGVNNYLIKGRVLPPQLKNEVDKILRK
jgi:CheY-like chemotaxis protein